MNQSTSAARRGMKCEKPQGQLFEHLPPSLDSVSPLPGARFWHLLYSAFRPGQCTSHIQTVHTRERDLKHLNQCGWNRLQNRTWLNTRSLRFRHFYGCGGGGGERSSDHNIYDLNFSSNASSDSSSVNPRSHHSNKRCFTQTLYRGATCEG